MDIASISNVGVIGAGTMGAGIAQVFLGAGCRVALYDASGEQARRGRERIEAGLKRWETKGQVASAEETLRRFTTAPDLLSLRSCQWIVEAIVEEAGAKADVFRTLGRLCSRETVLASNTSSLSITWLGAESGRPERMIGMHFFNPP